MNPEQLKHWEKIGGWFDYAPLYDYFVEQMADGGLFVECGVWKGRSLIYAADSIAKSGKQIRLIGIDRWEHDEWDGYRRIRQIESEKGETRTIKQQCIDNMKACGVFERIELIASDAIEAASLFTDRSVNVLWLDDRHDSPHIYTEIAAWGPKMAAGSFMGGHDYPGDIFEGVHAHFPNVLQCHQSWVVKL